jgi:hypothetical protein
VQGAAIIVQPVPQVTYQSGNASFVVQAIGQGNITYQWSLNGVAIPSATNDVLVLTNVQPEQAGAYVAEVSNEFGSVQSSEATLTVLPALIKAQPISRQVLEGGAISFAVTVDGVPPFTYQWQFNGVALAGMTNATLELANVLPAQQGAYSVVISNVFRLNFQFAGDVLRAHARRLGRKQLRPDHHPYRVDQRDRHCRWR